MTYLSCEKRREWIEQQVENAKKSWQKLIGRNNQQISGVDDRTKSTTNRNRGSKQPVDESSSKSG